MFSISNFPNILPRIYLVGSITNSRHQTGASVFAASLVVNTTRLPPARLK
jgi:hypothetical protein